MPEKGMKKNQIVEPKPKEDTGTDFMSTDSMMNMMMMMVVMSLAITMTPLSQNVNKYLAAQQSEGKQEPKELVADPMLRVYHITAGMPWTSAVIYNWGAFPVKIGFNGADQMFQVDPNQIYNASRVGTSMRIIAVYYQCLPGESTNVRLTGEY